MATENENNNQEKIYQISKHKSRYKIDKFALKIKEQVEMIELNPICIKEVVVVQDYDECIQPIFQIKAVLPPLIIDYINTHKDTTNIFIRLQRIDFESGADILKQDKVFNTSGIDNVCDTEFVLFSADSGKIKNLDEYKSVVETIRGQNSNDILYQINKSGENFANYTQEYQFFLWKESDLYNMRKVVNYVFSNCTVGDAAVGLLSDGGFTNILMAPPDNTETIAQIIIPPMSQMNVFTYLQKVYGMYDTDVTFFSDLSRTYILDKSGKCKAYEDNEYLKTIFSVVDSYNSDTSDVGSSTIDEKREFHNKVDIDNIAIRSLAPVNDVIRGNNSMYIDSRSNEITTVSGGSTQRGNGCVNVTTDQESSQYTKSRNVNKITELNLNLKLNNLIDYNYFAMTPNKSFIFSFKNKDFYQFNGYYRLRRATHIFMSESQGEMLAIMGSFEFVFKDTLSEEEQNAIMYDVFRTAQVTESGKTDAESKASENNAKDPSFNQSQDNQVAEGKMEAPKKETGGSNPPKSVGESSESSKIKPNDNPNKVNEKINNQEKNKEKTDDFNGSPVPKPLDEK